MLWHCVNYYDVFIIDVFIEEQKMMSECFVPPGMCSVVRGQGMFSPALLLSSFTQQRKERESGLRQRNRSEVQQLTGSILQVTHAEIDLHKVKYVQLISSQLE